jgi:dolichol-phosphate mannosyltransferase
MIDAKDTNIEYFSNYTIIIPTLNEEKNIGKLILYLTKNYPRISIIVSDDGSIDETKIIVLNLRKQNKNIHFIDRTICKNKGLTASVLSGIKCCKTKYFIVMDGDFQHPPEKIKQFCTLLQKYDIVVGKRNKVKNWRFDRKLMSQIATLMAKLRLIFKKTKCSDIMSGFLGMKTKIFIKSLKDRGNQKYQLDGYKVLFDFLKLNNKKYSIIEIKYNFGMRTGGKSKIGKKQIIAYLKSFLK